NTALCGAVNGLLLKTVRVDRPDTLVRLKWVGKNDMGTDFSDYGSSGRDEAGRDIRATFSYPMYETLRDSSRSTLSDLAAGAPQSQANIVIGGSAQTGSVFGASGSFYRVPRVPALRGRAPGPGGREAGRW